ncbi:hypothetical protein [Cellulosimicrobium cellulans]|uniref:hypothetical protein n=1 Tax=Cellulosimicrobium cellulans TaxID=1710 RepID=UPI000848D1A2|nr:hypothetical protein [Cellulosimicrobium cellulans]
MDPPPAPPALDLTLGSVQLTARQPAELVVTASNSGGRAAQQVSVDLVLPPGVQAPSARVVGGSSVAAVVRAETVPCGTAQPQGDGTSVVSCSVGVLDPGESRELAITVQADSGGEYTFSGSVRAEGVAPVVRTFTPMPATHFGPEVRVAALDGEGGRVDGLVLPLTNPGAGEVRLEVRNTGDLPAVDPVVSLPLPDGVRLVRGGNGADGWACEADGGAVSCTTDAELAPQDTTALDLTLLAAVDGAEAAEHAVAVRADAVDAHDGSTTVELRVGDWWKNAEDGLSVRAKSQCNAPGEPDLASVTVTYANSTAYDDLSVRLEAAGSSATVAVPVGAKKAVQVDDGVQFPGGTASLVLLTTVAGEAFEHRLDAGAFSEQRCWNPPWLSTADVAMVAENVGGTIRFTAVLTNTTGIDMDVRLLAPNTGTWIDVADSAAIAPLRDGASGELVLDTGLTETSRANPVLRQYRWHVDADGDGMGYQDPLLLVVDEQRIAPSSSAPTVGQCLFDPAIDTSRTPVTLHYDNTASTLPVTYSVDGRDDLSRTVQGHEALEVEVPGGVGEDTAFALLADGNPLETYEVDVDDCFPWNVEASADAAWTATPEGGSVVLTGTFRNEHAVTAMRVVMDAGEAGESEAVEVAPGQEVTLAVDTATRDLPAGEVIFRATRLDASGEVHEERVGYDAVRYAPAADAAPTVGECVFDPATDTSSAPVTLHLDNSRSTVPVTFAVAGVGETRVRAGATGTLEATVGTPGARFEVLADGVAVAAHDVAGVDCFRWAVEGSAAVDWAVENGTGAPVLSGTFHNQHQAAPLRVVMDAGALGASEPVEVAPGQTATLTVPLQGRDVKAGDVTFRATRLDGSGAEHTVTRPYDAYSYSPQWATDVSVEARWQDGSIKLIATLTNDSPETIDAQLSGGPLGTSPVVTGIAPGQTATLVADTRSTDVKPGRVAFRQTRTVLGKTYTSYDLTASFGGASYVPEWDVSAGVSTQCVPGGVALVPSLRNDSGETMHVVARTPYGTHDLGDVAPGASTSVEIATGGMSVRAGDVTFDLTRRVLGRLYSERITAGYAAVDCTVVDPAASLQLGEPYYDGGQGRSYRAVSVVLDNAASNAPVTFRVTGAAKGSWDLQAGERRTVDLGQVDARGATYVVHAGSWSQQFKVDAFSVAPQCAEPWRDGDWYGRGDLVSYKGRNYVATTWIDLPTRPDGWLGWLLWDDQGRCGEN